MTYTVTQYCVDCRYTDCVEVCPVEAFHIGPRMVYINPETCFQYWLSSSTDCNRCVTVCPFNKPPGLLHDIVRMLIRRAPWRERQKLGAACQLDIYGL